MTSRRVGLMAGRALLALAVIGASGCGSGHSAGHPGPLSAAARLYSSSLRVAARASSVHVAFSVIDDGQPVAMDMTFVRGRGGKVTQSTASGTLRIVDDGTTRYIDGSAAYWGETSYAAQAAALANRWVETSVPMKTGAARGLRLSDFAAFLSRMLKRFKPNVAGGETTIDGRLVRGVEDGQGDTLYLPVHGPPYPVEIVNTTQGMVTFDEWNAPVRLRPPGEAVPLVGGAT